jgi:hypothetical protein
MGSAGADHFPRYHLWYCGRSSHCEELSKYLRSRHRSSERCVGTFGLLDGFFRRATGPITDERRGADFTHFCQASSRHYPRCWIKRTGGREPRNDTIFWITDRIAAWCHFANSNRTGSCFQWRNTVYMLLDTYLTNLCTLLRRPSTSVKQANPLEGSRTFSVVGNHVYMYILVRELVLSS